VFALIVMSSSVDSSNRKCFGVIMTFIITITTAKMEIKVPHRNVD